MRMRHRVLVLSTLLLLAACGGGGGDNTPAPQPEPKLPYPVTPAGSQQDTYFGHTIADPYRWLEDIRSQATDAWVQAQNQFSLNYFTKLPDYAALTARLEELENPVSSTSMARSHDVSMQYQVEGVQDAQGRYFFQYKKQQTYDRMRPLLQRNKVSVDNVIYVADSADDVQHARAVVDVNDMRVDPDDHIELTGHQVTADGKYLLYMLTRNYADLSELHVVELGSGAASLVKVIPNILGDGFAIEERGADPQRVFYTAPENIQDAHVSPSTSVQLYSLDLGGESEPQLVVASRDPYERVTVSSVQDDWLYLMASTSSTMNHAILRLRLDDLQSGYETVLDGREQQQDFMPFMGGQGDASVPGMPFVTTDSAALYRLIMVDPDHPERENWHEILPNSAPGTVEYVNSNIIRCGDGYYAELLEHGSSRLVYYPLSGSSLSKQEVPVPDMGSVMSLKCEGAGPILSYTYASLTTPYTRYQYDPETGVNTLVSTYVYANYTPDDYETERLIVPGKDGVQISVYLAHRKGLPRNGDAPVLLYYYGGFRTPELPMFSSKNIPLLESGGVYAVVQVRGGAEYGNEWYEAGRLLNKQHTYDDVISVASYLIEQGWTRPERIGLEGHSNGGLTTAAVVLQRPDLFGVAFPSVGVLDLIRYDQFSGGYVWHDNYGRSWVREEFENLLRISPVHQVHSDQAYPPIFVFTGKSDGRVMPAHSYKFAATLQNVAGGTSPYLLHALPKQGHSMGNTLEYSSYMWSAFFHHTGTRYTGRGR